MVILTDYGRPMKSFFIETFGLEQTIWADKFWGIWGLFGRFISTHFGTLRPLSMLFNNQPLFLQKLSLYIQIPKIYLKVGVEFGPERIRNVVICL